MLRSYIKVTFKNLTRHKLYTFINIFGLAFGLAVSLLVIGHICFELSYEDFHENKDRIYRVECEYTSEEDMYTSAKVMPTMSRLLAEELPEVQKTTIIRAEKFTSIKFDEIRYRIINPYQGQVIANYEQVFFATPEYFDIFSFNLAQGNPEKVLTAPNTALITEKTVQLYFPDQDPVGKTIEINDKYSCTIVGIMKDIPNNTQLHCDILISYATLEKMDPDIYSWDNFGNDYVYFLLKEEYSDDRLSDKIDQVAFRHISSEQREKYHFVVKPLEDIYFGGFFGRRGDLTPMGEVSMIIEIGMLALFILVQAIANYVNLATARSSDRTKEVGVRKVFGASRGNLIRQFLGESMIITGIATVIGLALYEIIASRAQAYFPRQMLGEFYSSPSMIIGVIVLILVVGTLAGFYPALYLSRFRPAEVLYGKKSSKRSSSLLRKALVVVQFGIAAIFMFFTIVLIRQTNYIHSIDLGFDGENIVLLDVTSYDANNKSKVAKEEILSNTPITAVTVCNSPPGRERYAFNAYHMTAERSENDLIVVKSYGVDYDFLSTFSLNLIQGRWFSRDVDSDIENAIVIDEFMADDLFPGGAVGSEIFGRTTSYEIIGVVEDFQGTPFEIYFTKYSVIRLDLDNTTCVAARIPADDIGRSVGEIESVWNKVLPGEMFYYSFLSDEIERGYYGELDSQSKMILVLSVVTIAIACLGILGLVAFMAEQRKKEIGIRKVLGAPVSGIVSLLSREFIILIILANLIGCPIGFMLVNQMLKWYSFRIGIGVGTFLLPIAISITIALVVGGVQAFKAALTDPIKSIHHE